MVGRNLGRQGAWGTALPSPRRNGSYVVARRAAVRRLTEPPLSLLAVGMRAARTVGEILALRGLLSFELVGQRRGIVQVTQYLDNGVAMHGHSAVVCFIV